MSLTDIMSSMKLATYPTIAMVIFGVVFVAIVARVMSRRNTYAHESMLPFEDGTAHSKAEGRN
ncbi:MAG: hypothetical protein ACOYN0_10320 [Phycisphaerales bacterium]